MYHYGQPIVKLNDNFLISNKNRILLVAINKVIKEHEAKTWKNYAGNYTAVLGMNFFSDIVVC